MEQPSSSNSPAAWDHTDRHFLLNSKTEMEKKEPRLYKTGEIVPQTGIYRVIHGAHRLPHEAVVIEGFKFPRCQKCSGFVRFELTHSDPAVYRHARYYVFELPVIDDGDSSISA
jgi:hypothetical protein